jgi:hypothetical protein
MPQTANRLDAPGIALIIAIIVLSFSNQLLQRP